MAFVVTATWTARPGEEEAVAQAVAALIAPSRAEPGMLMYQPHRDPADPHVFYFYEQYLDEAAYQAHGSSAHFAAHGFGDAIPRLVSRERKTFHTWPDLA